jgi:hypothetical protein
VRVALDATPPCRRTAAVDLSGRLSVWLAVLPRCLPSFPPCCCAATRVLSGQRASCPCRPCSAASRLGAMCAHQSASPSMRACPSASPSARARLGDPSSAKDMTGRGLVLFPIFPCPPSHWGHCWRVSRERPSSAHLPRQRFHRQVISPFDLTSLPIRPRGAPIGVPVSPCL